MSLYDHANTSLNSFNSPTIVVLSSSRISFSMFTSRGSSNVPGWSSSRVDDFMRCETSNSFSKASCAFRSSPRASWSGSVISSSRFLMYGVTAYTMSTSNKGMILGFSVRYWSTSSSTNPSSILIASTLSRKSMPIGRSNGTIRVFSRGRRIG